MKLRKIITIMLTAAMLMTNTVFAAHFDDIRDHWAEKTINELADRGIVDGLTDTEFNPDGEVTRAQYLKMIMEATGVQTAEYRPGECLEATANDWYAPYLQKALDCGLIPEAMIAGFKQTVEYEVDDDGNATKSKIIYSGAFNGNLPIARDEMAVLTQYFYQYSRTVITNKNQDISEAKDFLDDDEIDDWAKNSVKLAVLNGFIEGMEDNKFNPKESTTRAQATTVIYRVIEKNKESEKK